ncbi:LysM peptidoglycan-binding domain-containing protein [Acetonema longum]|uniref:Peptidoglycan-binding LysM n=1 Tax=Acetonema longum DSM 6540 TaxID=1009370 RepID=F7NEL4_9FIRM|nr:LysM peptidoglycan-binding domain-containing protein [Acetonema longum]EGO65425.1 peptidoglycan-binding LysM [Acetonema longum DSM 6540]
MRIILGLILLLFALSVVYAAPSEPASESYVIVRVYSGDTVWDIAGRQAGDKEDIRDIIWQIREMNHLDKNAFLQPGQMLRVPRKKL